MAYVSKLGKRRTVSDAKARQFDTMAENWVRNAEKSGRGDDYATAAKQALVSAFYWHHNGDAPAAVQQLDRAAWALEHAKSVGGARKQTMTWIKKNGKATARLVGRDDGEFDGYRRRSNLSGMKLSTGIVGLGVIGFLLWFRK